MKTTRWSNDGKRMLTGSSYLSVCFAIHIVLIINWNAVDWSIFCRSCRTPFSDYRGPETKQSGYLRILSREHLSGSRRPECNTRFHPLPFRQTTPVLSSEICHLGEFTLVLEPGNGPQLCAVGDIVASMGAPIYSHDSTRTVQSREASTNACILCEWGGQDAYSVGS